jgi:hypothetical protein
MRSIFAGLLTVLGYPSDELSNCKLPVSRDGEVMPPATCCAAALGAPSALTASSWEGLDIGFAPFPSERL